MKHLLISCLLAVNIFSMGGCSSNSAMAMPDEPESPTSLKFDNKMVIYEANPRFFSRTDCFHAISDRLDEIKNMGANVLWLMPVYEPGELKSVGSSYCIKNYEALNATYGTLDDLKSLVDKAHSMDMKVILDWVANHTSWDHVWIDQHEDWYTVDNEGNITSPAGQNWNDVADLNYDNEEMRKAMVEAMKYWVNEVGIDGYRCDYSEGVPHDFWADAIAQLRMINPDLIMLSESEGGTFFDDGFDMVYDWKYASYLKDLFQGKTTFTAFYEKAREVYSAVPEGKNSMRYVSNHDVASQSTMASLYGSADALPAAYTLTAMLEGIPLVYSSMETKLGGVLSFFNYNPLTWDSDLEQEYAAINKVYEATSEVRSGEIKTYEAENAAVFTHTIPGHVLLVMVNTSDTPVTVKVPITYSGVTMQDMFDGKSVEMPASMELPAYHYVIYYK